MKSARAIPVLGRIMFLFAVPFLVMLGIGPFPVFIFGIAADHLATLLLAIVLFYSMLNKYTGVSKSQFIIVLYLFLILLSVLASERLDLSMSRYFVSLLYGGLLFCLMSKKLDYSTYRKLAIFAFASLFLESLIITYIFNFSDFSGATRFTLASDYSALDSDGFSETPAVDPNMTAIGMFFIIAFCMPFFELEILAIRSKLVVGISLIPVMFALNALASRTAIAALCIFFIVYAWYKIKSLRKVLYLLVLVLLIFAMLLWLYPDEGGGVFARFNPSVILEEANAETGRLWLIRTTFDYFISDPKNIVAGIDYFYSNPHNEYLRNFFDSGLFVGFFHIYMIGYIYINSRRRLKLLIGHSVFVDAIALPFIFMLGTYGHTKTFWVGLGFIWLFSNLRVPDNLKMSPQLKCAPGHLLAK